MMMMIDATALTALMQVEPARRMELTGFSLAFMLVSMGLVTLLTVWAYSRILRTKRHFDPDGTGPAHSPVPGRTERPRE